MGDSGYALRAELRGHQQDVRGCLSCELGLVTASRDKTVKLWVEEGNCDYTCISTFVGHKDYVGPLAYMPKGTSAGYPESALVSGSRDTTVIVWDPTTAQPLTTLTGHAYQVTALGVLNNGDIVSGALDKTLKVWRDGHCLRTLEGHSGPVLCLSVLPMGDVLSGSGDSTIRQWAGATNRCVQVYTGHTDTVRGLCVLPDGLSFVSASHDTTCKVWTLSGQILANLIGHTALVYAVASTSDGLLATGSEDNTCRVWHTSGECLQVIEHVACVWDVSFTSGNDLITACADAVTRVWTTKDENKASADVLATYHKTIENVKAERAAAAAGGGDGGQGGGAGDLGLPPGLKVEDPQSLVQPGAKDGQTKVVKESNGAINAYTWDMAGWQWEKIGEVQAAPGGGGGAGGTIKKGYKGKEWDFVIDVEFEEGGPPRKLALNRGDNPYLVADAFLEEQGLPAHFRDQIVQFIIQNTDQDPRPNAAALANMPVTGGFCDPYTGSSGSAAPQPNGGGWPQPQQPSAVPLASLPITGGFVDPFTGSSSSQQPQQQQSADGGGVQPPLYLVFDNVPPLDKLAAKVRELSGQLVSSGAVVQALSEEEAGSLQGLLTAAGACAPSTSPAPPVNLAPEQLVLLAKMLEWPAAQLFPILDICRLLVLHPTAAASVADLTHPGAPLAQALGVAAGTSGPAQQTALRLLTNTFKQPVLREWAARVCGGTLDAFAGAGGSAVSKAVRLSWATLLYNYSVLATQPSGQGEEMKMQVLSALVELTGNCPLDDTDSATRGLTAISILVVKDKSLVQVAKDLGVQDVLRRVHDAPESKTLSGRPVLEAAIKVMKCVQ